MIGKEIDAEHVRERVCEREQVIEIKKLTSKNMITRFNQRIQKKMT